MKIAAYLNRQGEPASLYEPGCFRLYQASAGDGGWLLVHEVPFAVDLTQPFPAIKEALHAAVGELGDCQILVSAEVRGTIYAVLQEELGFRVWKSEGALLQQLDSVRGKEAEHEANKRFAIVAFAGKAMPAPLLVGDPRAGCFWIDLKEALTHESSPTSRQILIPFLERGHFNRLEVLCDHLPRWLSWELERLDMSAASDEIDATGSGLRITIFPSGSPHTPARPLRLADATPALPCPRERARQDSAVVFGFAARARLPGKQP